jgi:hypothetical protein
MFDPFAPHGKLQLGFASPEVARPVVLVYRTLWECEYGNIAPPTIRIEKLVVKGMMGEGISILLE